jgi:hypothetical protein
VAGVVHGADDVNTTEIGFGSWLRLAGHEPVPAIYGPSGDVKWDEADPTYSL